MKTTRRQKRKAQRWKARAANFGKAGALYSMIQRLPPETRLLVFNDGKPTIIKAKDYQ